MKNTIKFILFLSILLSNIFASDLIKTKINTLITDINKKYNTKNIIVSIMNSRTGKIIYINDLQRAILYEFEPNSTMIPISIAIALKYKKLKINEYINTKNGTMSIDGWIIKDNYIFDKNMMTVKGLIIYSSKIGIAQIANRLSAKEFIFGMKSFGISIKTGISTNEKVGRIASYAQYNAYKSINKDNIFLATSSYGEGIKITHMQLLKAYNIFNNDGKIVSPYINNKASNKPIQIISKNIANSIKSYIANSSYKNQFTNTYFKFYNINNKKYTIAITINNKTLNRNDKKVLLNIIFDTITKLVNNINK